MYKLLVAFLVFGLTGCLGNYPVTTADPNVVKKSKEEKVKEGVTNHLIGIYGASYKSVQFGDLFVLKPKEIKVLDEMIELKNQLPLLEEHYGDRLDSVMTAQDQKIAAQKELIKEKNVYPWYEINHLYSISEPYSVTVFEFDFEVFPNYKIKDVHQKMEVKLSKPQYKTFEYILNQNPLYVSENYAWANDRNKEFYTQVFASLEHEENYKGELLKTIIGIADYIKKNNEFNEGKYTLEVVKEWEKENVSDSLISMSYGGLTPRMDSLDNLQLLVGYDLEHDFKRKGAELDAAKVKMIYKFDLNFVLTQILEKEL